MEKSGSLKHRRGRRRILQIMLTALAVITWGTFDQVLATPAERIFPPHELLDHRQLGSGFVQTVASRPDTALNGNAVQFSNSRGGGHEHGLRPHLAGAQGSQTQELRTRRNGLPGAVVEDDGINLHEQMTTSRTAHVLNGDGHRQRIARLNKLLPLVDQRDANDHASWSHPLIEIFRKYQQILGGNLVGPSRKGVGLGSGLQPLNGNTVRLPGDGYALLGQTQASQRSLQSLSGLMQTNQQASSAQDSKEQLRPGKKCYLPGPLGCSPLSTKIGALFVCGLVAWCLIFRIFDLLDSRRRNWFLIFALGAIAATLYLLPSYLVVGFPWDW